MDMSKYHIGVDLGQSGPDRSVMTIFNAQGKLQIQLETGDALFVKHTNPDDCEGMIEEVGLLVDMDEGSITLSYTMAPVDDICIILLASIEVITILQPAESVCLK